MYNANAAPDAVKVDLEQRGSVLCARLTGGDTLDTSNSTDVKQLLASSLTGEEDLVIDMSGVRYVDSSGVGSLISVLKVIRRANRRMVLAGVTPPVLSVLDVIRLTAIFEFQPTVDEAVATLST